VLYQVVTQPPASTPPDTGTLVTSAAYELTSELHTPAPMEACVQFGWGLYVIAGDAQASHSDWHCGMIEDSTQVGDVGATKLTVLDGMKETDTTSVDITVAEVL